jgi:hypothetical protein
MALTALSLGAWKIPPLHVTFVYSSNVFKPHERVELRLYELMFDFRSTT